MATDTDVLVIGAGMSGLGFAVQLIRKYGCRDFELVEKYGSIGGTWHANSYPGCGCDVPSHFYSYSFAPKADWSQMFAMQPEIQEYFDSVAKQYNIIPHTRFHTELKTADWDSKSATWLVRLYDSVADMTYSRRCKILVSAVGALSTPNPCDIPGADSFKGRIFHSARWDHTFDYKDKDVVCIGNGCSATQFVPVMSDGPGKVKKITQFSRQAHWLFERPNPRYSETFKWAMKYIPGLRKAFRSYLFLMQEKDFAGFPMESGDKIRKELAKTTTEYIRQSAPEKYRDALVPKTAVGCKRKVMDTDYLASLHRDNVELIHDDPVEEITPSGVRTKSGRLVTADAIVLANGFSTQLPLFPMTIRGENGISVQDHWHRMTVGGTPEAYFGTCLSDFPNFFILMGPNTISGHLSVIFTTECQINFILQAIGPILKSLRPPVLSKLVGYCYPDSVAVRGDAEKKDVEWADEKAKTLVWASGCSSWFIDPETGRNTAMYPDWQAKLWLRSVFVPWRDFVYAKSEGEEKGVKAKESKRRPVWVGGVLAGLVFLAGGGVLLSSLASSSSSARLLGLERLRGGVGGSLGDAVARLKVR